MGDGVEDRPRDVATEPPGSSDDVTSHGPGTHEPHSHGAASTALDALVRRVQRPAVSQRGPSGLPIGRLADLVPTSVPRGLAVAVLLVAGVSGFLGWQVLARPAPIEQRMPMAAADPSSGSQPGADGAGGTDGEAEEQTTRSAESPSAPEGNVTLHVAGAVNRPGLVSVPEGSRVADAAAAAGGLAAAADVDRVNLAATVADGSRVFIPVHGEEIPPEVPVAAGSGASGEPSAEAPLDLNTADASALEELPGVGPATADAIVQHRDENGAFKTVDSLLDVRGIGEAKLEALRDLVTVG